MGDAADDAFNSALEEEQLREILRSVCRGLSSKNCCWEFDEDGLRHCKTCGVVVDD